MTCPTLKQKKGKLRSPVFSSGPRNENYNGVCRISVNTFTIENFGWDIILGIDECIDSSDSKAVSARSLPIQKWLCDMQVCVFCLLHRISKLMDSERVELNVTSANHCAKDVSKPADFVAGIITKLDQHHHRSCSLLLNLAWQVIGKQNCSAI